MDQHHRFDAGEIKRLELTDLERREIPSFSDWCGLELNDSRLATIRERGREIISNSLADNLVRWIDKKIPILLNILHKDETQEISADSTQHQHIIIRREDRSISVYTHYRLIDTKENKSLEIRHNRNRLEMISGVVTPSISEQIKIIIDELENPEKVIFDVEPIPEPEIIEQIVEQIVEPKTIESQPMPEIVDRPVTNTPKITPKKTTKGRKSNQDRER